MTKKHLVPPARVFTGFLKKLKKHKREIVKTKGVEDGKIWNKLNL